MDRCTRLRRLKGIFFTILKASNSCFEMGISRYEYLVLGVERIRSVFLIIVVYAPRSLVNPKDSMAQVYISPLQGRHFSYSHSCTERPEYPDISRIGILD